MKWPALISLIAVLTRIADALDRAYPIEPKPNRAKFMDEDNLTYYSPEADVAAEEEEERKRLQGEIDRGNPIPHQYGYDL